MKSLQKLAVTKVHIKCNGIWYVQSDGLAMGASLAVRPMANRPKREVQSR